MFKKVIEPKKLGSLLISLILVIITFFLVNLQNQQVNQKILGLQTQLKTDRETVQAWEQILEERPDYRDGWIRLAAAYYKLGDKEKARQALQKAKQLDPTNPTIINFEKLLED